MSITDYIERHIKRLLEQDAASVVDIQRNLLADQLGCAPSQINYVLATRFSRDRGYLIESRRGGGGYIRIIRLSTKPSERVREMLSSQRLTQAQAMQRIAWLEEYGWLSKREAALMRAALDSSVLKLSLPERDIVRAQIFRAMLTTLIKLSGGG